MTASDDNPSYDVGYGKPPKRAQFTKGASGNPKGRPRGAKNLATVLDKTISERVIVTENGSRKSISKLEATVKQLVNKAASGESKAMQQLLQLVQLIQGVAPSPVADINLNEADARVMKGILARLQRTSSAAVPTQQTATDEPAEPFKSIKEEE